MISWFYVYLWARVSAYLYMSFLTGVNTPLFFCLYPSTSVYKNTLCCVCLRRKRVKSTMMTIMMIMIYCILIWPAALSRLHSVKVFYVQRQHDGCTLYIIFLFLYELETVPIYYAIPQLLCYVLFIEFLWVWEFLFTVLTKAFFAGGSWYRRASWSVVMSWLVFVVLVAFILSLWCLVTQFFFHS